MKFDTLKNYELIQQKTLHDLQSEGYLLRHKKSGARVLLMENNDENKVFSIGFRTPPEDSTGVPHILISPSLNAPFLLGRLCWLALIPGVTPLLDRLYKPREGDRQVLHFTYPVLRKYLRHGKSALGNSPSCGSNDYFFAFFGTRDHYRRTGIVSIKSWKKYFGDSYVMYDGTHFTEEEHIRDKVIPLICNMLNIKQ